MGIDMHNASQSAAAGAASTFRPRALELALFSAISVACSAEAPCEPPIPEGAIYQVTLGADTEKSNKCHIVDTTRIRTFEIKASKTLPTMAQPSCSVTPASEPPPTQSIKIESCEPDSRDMLGVMCKIQYPSTCPGQMRFFFDEANGASVNWSSPQVNNIVFKVQDFMEESCLGGIGNCTDEYAAQLVRIR
jgi:hypothetical protein